MVPNNCTKISNWSLDNKKQIDREKERKKKTAEDVSDDCLSINSLNPII